MAPGLQFRGGSACWRRWRMRIDTTRRSARSAHRPGRSCSRVSRRVAGDVTRTLAACCEPSNARSRLQENRVEHDRTQWRDGHSACSDGNAPRMDAAAAHAARGTSPELPLVTLEPLLRQLKRAVVGRHYKTPPRARVTPRSGRDCRKAPGAKAANLPVPRKHGGTVFSVAWRSPTHLRRAAALPRRH